VGIYAYRRAFLLQLAASPPSALEKLERLEQLRVLAHGGSICVGFVSHASIAVDTRADYEQFVQMYRRAA
jgi:3-deoxy-manno-octulosonate cytidylyltransferase (CMP-KDO synthetase)